VLKRVLKILLIHNFLTSIERLKIDVYVILIFAWCKYNIFFEIEKSLIIDSQELLVILLRHLR
jgi:hypothetical protein